MKLTLQLVVVVLNVQPNFSDTVEPRFNQEPDLTNCQGTGEICSLYRTPPFNEFFGKTTKMETKYVNKYFDLIFKSL